MMRRKTWSMIAAKIVGATKMEVNSFHHQAVDRAAESCRERAWIESRWRLNNRDAQEPFAFRQRGQHMIAMDADRCPGVEFFTGSAGSSTLTVDQIVGGIVPLRGQSTAGNVPASNATSGTAIPSRPPTSAVPVK